MQQTNIAHANNSDLNGLEMDHDSIECFDNLDGQQDDGLKGHKLLKQNSKKQNLLC